MSDTARSDTHSDTHSDESDLAYLKRLVVAGRGEPAPFLMLMAVFGGVYGLYALVIGALVLFEEARGQTPWPDGASHLLAPWAFLFANTGFLAAAAWTMWQTFGPRRIAISRAASGIWSAAFMAAIALVAAVTTSAGNLHPMVLPEALPSALLVLWGSAWWATAIVSDRRWLLAVAVGSFAGAVALPAMVPGNWGLPILAACLLGLAFLPAVLLMRGRPA
jgi:hypothetical protein